MDAVIDQLAKGTMFGMGSELEFMVSEEIVKMVPCAEPSRLSGFAKTGYGFHSPLPPGDA
jgi:glutamate-1-semialdehyde aminotransferase